jgi:hypothetical protein
VQIVTAALSAPPLLPLVDESQRAIPSHPIPSTELVGSATDIQSNSQQQTS